MTDTDRCDGCGETVRHIDAGFSPALHEMGHDCGGTWRRAKDVEKKEESDEQA
jgi:hypothetical protein